MSDSRAEGAARLDRLAGDGKGSGGGLALPGLFSALLVELLDRDPETVPTPDLVVTAEKALGSKSARVLQVWGSWDALADDALQQMASRKFVMRTGGGWTLGGKFAAGRRLVVVPARDGKNGHEIGVTVYERAEREHREHLAEMQMMATELASKLLPDGAGIRPVDRAQVEKIRESISGTGRLYRVLVDGHGHILDGKHRLAADPDWPRKTIATATDDLSALAVARLANMGQPLPPKVASAIDRLLGDSKVIQEAQREKIRSALAEFPDDSHNAIARRLGYASGNKTVGEVCQQQTSPCSHGLSGQGARTDRKRGGRPRVVTPELEEQITELVAERPLVSVKELSEEFDIGEMPARDARQRARGRLDERAAATETATIPVAPGAIHTALMEQILELIQFFKNAGPEPDPASELTELVRLRTIISERIAALQGE